MSHILYSGLVWKLPANRSAANGTGTTISGELSNGHSVRMHTDEVIKRPSKHDHLTTSYLHGAESLSRSCFVMQCWRRAEKIGWTNRVENEEISKESRREVLHIVKRRKANRIAHILRRTAFYDMLLKER